MSRLCNYSYEVSELAEALQVMFFNNSKVNCLIASYSCSPFHQEAPACMALIPIPNQTGPNTE